MRHAINILLGIILHAYARSKNSEWGQIIFPQLEGKSEEWTQGQTAWGGADFKKQQLILLFFGADSSRMMMIIWVHNINITHSSHKSV